jgi:adenylate kinase
VTGEPLYQRSDDNASVLKKRLEAYHNQTTPVATHYAKQGKLTAVDASTRPEQVWSTLNLLLGIYSKPCVATK